MKIIESKKRTALKRIDDLRNKYPEFNVWLDNDSKYLYIKLKKGKIFEKLVMEVGRDWINLYKKEYLDMAKEIANSYNIEEIELFYTSDLDENPGVLE